MVFDCYDDKSGAMCLGALFPLFHNDEVGSPVLEVMCHNKSIFYVPWAPERRMALGRKGVSHSLTHTGRAAGLCSSVQPYSLLLLV